MAGCGDVVNAPGKNILGLKQIGPDAILPDEQPTMGGLLKSQSPDPLVPR